MSDELDTAAIRSRAEAATPGPWVRDRIDDGMEHVGAPESDGGVWVAVTEHCATDYATEDAEFIAHAREDIPALLAALTAAEQRADTAEAAIRAEGCMTKRRLLAALSSRVPVQSEEQR